MATNLSNDQRNLPAFPFVIDSGAIEPGLTKRELFAAMAMQGLLACDRVSDLICATEAVAHADALLTALEVAK